MMKRRSWYAVVGILIGALLPRTSLASTQCENLDTTSPQALYLCLSNIELGSSNAFDSLTEAVSCTDAAGIVQRSVEAVLGLRLNSSGMRLRPSCVTLKDTIANFSGRPATWAGCDASYQLAGKPGHVSECLSNSAVKIDPENSCSEVFSQYENEIVNGIDFFRLQRAAWSSLGRTVHSEVGEFKLSGQVVRRGAEPEVYIDNLPRNCTVIADALELMGALPRWAACTEFDPTNQVAHLRACLSATSAPLSTCETTQLEYQSVVDRAFAGERPSGFVVPTCSVVAEALTGSELLRKPVWVNCLDYSPTNLEEHYAQCVGRVYRGSEACIDAREDYEARLRLAYAGALPEDYVPATCDELATVQLALVEEQEAARPAPQVPSIPQADVPNEAVDQNLVWVLGGALLLLMGFFVYRNAQSAESSENPADVLKTPQESSLSKIKRINAQFDEGSGKAEATLQKEVSDVVHDENALLEKVVNFKFSVYARFVRNIGAMTAADREMLRVVYLLEQIQDELTELELAPLRLGMVYGDGKASIVECSTNRSKFNTRYKRYLISKGLSSDEDFVKLAMKHHNLNTDTTRNRIVGLVDKLQQSPRWSKSPFVTEAASRLRGGGAWASDGELSDTFDPSAEYSLFFGVHEESGKPVRFSGEGSIITIAAPGSGKTQSNVLTNLLEWDGPAIVLDVKGEIYEATASWRMNNVGPIYRFAPLEGDQSDCFNPLDLVRSDPEFLWEDSRYLASMIIVPKTDSKDPFWETRAQDFLTAAISVVCSEPEGSIDRSLARVSDFVHAHDLPQMLAVLQGSEIRAMRRAGSSWEKQASGEAKQFDAILAQAQTAMSAWESAKVERVISHSDWHPFDLREAPYPTIYISLKPGEIDVYSSLLRVFIAQHIRTLISELPEREVKPVLFMLDELPRLKYMPPVEEALDVGRQYGIKLWMFAQSLGQLEKAYPNAKGMIGSCAVRSFMNPSMHDGTAKRISEELGMFESPLDGSKQLIAKPQDLAGLEYEGLQLVLPSGRKPIKARKQFAYATEPYRTRMNDKVSE